MTTHTQAVSTETLLQLVADPRRRTVLHHLIAHGDGAVELDELIEAIAASGGTTTSSHSSDGSPPGVELYHRHLPQLAEAGIIEYDRRSGTVRYHATERVEKLLQFISTHLE